MGFPRAAEHLRPFGRRRSGLRRCPGAGIALQDPGEEGGPQPDPCPDPRCGFGSGVSSLWERPPCDAAWVAAEQSAGAAPVPSEQPGGCSGITSASPGRCTAETPSSFPRCSALSCPIAPQPKPRPAALAPAKGPVAEHSLTHRALRQPQPRNTLQVLRLQGGKQQPARPDLTGVLGHFPTIVRRSLPRDEAGAREGKSTTAKLPRSFCFSRPWQSCSPDTDHGTEKHNTECPGIQGRQSMISSHLGLPSACQGAAGTWAPHAAAVPQSTTAMPSVGQFSSPGTLHSPAM